MTHQNNGQNSADFVRTEELLKDGRPELSALRLDEMKRDVLAAHRRGSRVRSARPLRTRLLALTLFVLLFAISTSNAAAKALNWVSGGSLSKTLGTQGNTGGISFLFGSYHFGGDTTDDAGHETYCKDDKGSDDNDASSGDHSDGDKSSDDRDGSSGDQSDEHGGYSKSGGGKLSMATGGGGGGGDDCSSDDGGGGGETSDDRDKSSGDHSDEKSDDRDKSSGDNSDGDKHSDDRDASSGDYSDEKSDDRDASSDDHSDW